MTSFLIRKKFLPLVGLLLLGGAHCALAEPLHFVCKGEDSYVKAGQVVSIIGDTRSLTIEMDTAKDNSEPIAGTAWVGGYGKGTWLALPGDNGVSIIGGDVHSKSGLWVGTLDRVTGSFHVTLEGPGPCFAMESISTAPANGAKSCSSAAWVIRDGAASLEKQPMTERRPGSSSK